MELCHQKKSIKRKRFTAVLFIIVFGLFLGLQSIPAQAQSSKESSRRVLRVGFEGMTVPCQWTQSGDSGGGLKLAGQNQYLSGFEVEYMKKVCALAGYEIEACKYDWDGLMMAVPSGKVDCAIAMIAPTGDRKQTMDFTEPYYYADTVAVVRKDGPYAQADSIEKLRGARATSMLNTLWYSVQLDRIPDVDKKAAMENVPAMVVALQSDKTDVILLDRPTAKGVVAANDDLCIAPMEGSGNFNTTKDETAVAIAVSKGDETLLKNLNEAIAQIPSEDLEEMIDDACRNQPIENAKEDVSALSFFAMVRLLVNQYGIIFLKGAGIALLLAFFGTIIGTLVGCVAGAVSAFQTDADMSVPKRWLIRLMHGVVGAYVWLFRGTPMMVQAMVIYYGAAQVFNWDMNPLWAGLAIVSINTGAYMSETVRGGILSVDKGQYEGAQAIGMSPSQAMILVILPQGFRSILPQIGNYFISNIKDTSMLSVITVGELFYRAREAAGQYFRFFEVFLIVSLIYLFLTTLATLLLRLAERKLFTVHDYNLKED